MNKKEAFLKFIRNCRITPEEYQLAKTYYLQEADEREIDTYNNFLKILVPALQKSYIKSSLHFKALAKKHGLSEQDALEFIQSFQIYDSNIFLNDLQNKGINIEEYLRGLYVACQNFNYYKSKLVDLARKIDITYKLFLELVQIYMKEYLKLSKKEISLFFKKVETSEDFYMFLNKELVNDFENALYYARNLATEQEVLLFDNLILQIVGEFYSDDLSLQAMGEKIKEKYHISLDSAKKIIREYSCWRTYNKSDKDLSKYKIACEMFLNDYSYYDISDYLRESEISWEYLRRTYLDVYIKTFIPESIQNDAYNKILSGMQKYLNTKRNARRVLKTKLRKEPFEEKIFMEAKRFITKLVYEDKGVETFINELGVETYYRYITIVDKFDTPLYDLYLFRRNNKSFELDENFIKSLMYYISNGILENGVLREFNILDYFRMFRLPISSLIKLLQDYDNEIKMVIVSFLLRNKSNLHPLNNLSFSDVTEEEDNAVRNYLISNDLPMFDMVYTLALEEYRNGKLYNTQNSRK